MPNLRDATKIVHSENTALTCTHLSIPVFEEEFGLHMEEYDTTRECLAIVVARSLKSDDVLHALVCLFVDHGSPEHIRSHNGSELTAKAVRDWLGRIGVKTLYIEPGSPWENGYNESFNSKLRDELFSHAQYSFSAAPHPSKDARRIRPY